MKRGPGGSLLWRVLLPISMCACASSLPESRPDVDAALASCRPSGIGTQAALKSELLERAWGRDPEDPWHEVALLHTGTDALTVRAHLIRAARESIDVQVFAWEPDEAGDFLLQLLLEAAQRGVRVRLLVDLMANQGRADVARICAMHSNLNLRFYNLVGRRSKISGQEFLREVTVSFRWTNQRMHNKVMVVDGRVAIVGGRNIGESYFDMDPEFNYLDRDVLVVGPAAGSAETSFEQYWDWERTIPAVYLDDVAEELLEWSAEAPPPAVKLSPLSRYDWVRERSEHASIEANLLFTRMHRVERVVFVAGRPGKPPWDEATTEAGVLIWRPAVTSELEQELRLAMSNANAWRSALHPRIPLLSSVNDVITGLSRALPIFDLWPVRDNGNYELREGATPLPTHDPDFHGHYVRVGEFPGPVSTGKAMKTRLFSIFGGLILGLS